MERKNDISLEEFHHEYDGKKPVKFQMIDVVHDHCRTNFFLDILGRHEREKDRNIFRK